jgi:hypothetical protein
MSLAMALGGFAGNVVVPWLASAVSIEAAFGLVAAVVLAGAAACLRLPRTGPVEDVPDVAVVGVAAGARNARDTRPN